MTISHIIDRFVYDGNLEGALKYLLSAEHRGLVPEAKSAQKVIIMAAQQNHARLAVELAMWFEKNSVRKLDRVVWVHCLLSSAENLYVCVPVLFLHRTGSKIAIGSPRVFQYAGQWFAG